MIELKDLDGFKLVRGENIANSRDTLRAIEEAVVQGSQGWGVVDEQSVLLAVVAELRWALTTAVELSGVADSCVVAENALKGKQMELGRVKKALDDSSKRHHGLLEIIKAQSQTIEKVTRERDAARAAGLGLLNEQA